MHYCRVCTSHFRDAGNGDAMFVAERYDCTGIVLDAIGVDFKSGSEAHFMVSIFTQCASVAFTCSG